MRSKPFLCPALFAAIIFSTLFLGPQNSSAYSVNGIAATYSNGQVFLTWKSPAVTNMKYKVYRSTTMFISSSQLNSSTYLGYVMDSSGKNIRVSRLKQEDVFYCIEDGGAPLASNRGLYVVTCSNNQLYFYAVTVTNLATNKEIKDITLGKNSLLLPVAEFVAEPKPVFQESVVWSTGEVANRYVQFGNNQDLPHYPAMTNAGSYGFNFNMIKRGQANNGPLFVFFEGLNPTAISGQGIEPFDDVTNCYIISLDDWLPDPSPKYNDEHDGLGTFWCCYHENFNIYSDNNPVPTSGVVRTYAQKQFAETIQWAHDNLPVDASRTYLIGLSSGGFGALLTANVIPQKIAAVYAVVEPVRLKAIQPGTEQQQWGSQDTDLETDVKHPVTGSPILIWDLLDIKRMMDINLYESFPLIFSIHGKNDVVSGWNDKPKFYDSADATRHGGIYYWDRREHDRDKADFLDSETMPDLTIYKTTKSYPAFSNCSINQDPGNGTPTNGDPYGAINGYLTWDNDNIKDEECAYTIRVSIKDFYVGGVLDDEQYNTCYSDITFRRLQNFNPAPGNTIKWNNYDHNNVKIQSGSFTFNGGLITLTGLKVNKSENRIELKITNCTKEGQEDEIISSEQPDISVVRTSVGYQLIVEMDDDQKATLNLYDVLGRLAATEPIFLQKGMNTLDIPQKGKGLFIAELRGATFSVSEKLIF